MKFDQCYLSEEMPGCSQEIHMIHAVHLPGNDLIAYFQHIAAHLPHASPGKSPKKMTLSVDTPLDLPATVLKLH